MFHININKTVPIHRIENLDHKHTATIPNTTTILHDIPPEIKEALKGLEEKEREKKIKDEAEAAEKAMENNMTKFNNALNSTFDEIMNGASVQKEE